MSEPVFRPGLEGVVAAETRLSRVDGEAGELWIAGFPVEDLAPNADFEETIHLLLHGHLPTATELESQRRRLQDQRRLPERTLELLRAAAAEQTEPMDALRMGVATLGLGTARAANADEAIAAGGAFDPDSERLIALLPVLVATYWRLLQGLPPVEADPELGHAANYLYMLGGEPAEERQLRALETYLNTVVDHGMNASTFTARVIVSTGSDLISAVTGAIGALKGPLHGGAPGPALDTVLAIGSAARAEPYLRDMLARGERLMGFGHRVYKVRDPRAEVLLAAAEQLYRGSDDEPVYELSRQVEGTAVRLLAELKPGARLETNVEFYTALVLHGIGLDTPLFTPTFAVSRVVGWAAHAAEQRSEGRLMRPRARFVGGGPHRFVPLGERSAPVPRLRAGGEA